MLNAGWNAPGVTAFSTLRTGGTSQGPYASLNLATHVGDDADRVRQNRVLLAQSRGWTTSPLWLDQVHGTTVVRAEDLAPGSLPRADGAVTRQRGRPLVVLTADCLPVLACDNSHTVVGAFHAGWRGLLAGVLEEGLRVMDQPASEIQIWIGPAIGAASYQVEADVRDAFLVADPAHAAEFVPDGPDHWLFDLVGAATRRLNAAGVTMVTRGNWDTLADTDLFFSHRRQAPCGRIGTFICLEEP